MNLFCARGLTGVGLAAFSLASLSATAKAETITLQQALAAAYETNTQLEAQRATLRATDEDVATAISGWRPTVTATGSYGYTHDRTQPPEFFVVAPNGHPRDATLSITQPVLNGTTIPQTKEAKAEVQAGRAQLTSMEQSTLFNAAKAYFDVLADEAELNYKRHNASLLNDQFHMTQERVAIRDLARSDLDLVQARLSAANADVATAEGNLAVARAAFLRTVGLPVTTLEATPKLPPVPPTEDQAMTLALNDNPDLVGAKYQLQQADEALTAAYGALAPSVSVQLQFRRSADELGPRVRDSSVSAIGQLRVPLYQSGTEYAQIRRSVELRSKAVMQAADEERIVRQGVDSAWQTLTAARSGAGLNRQQVQAAQSAYDGVVIGVRAGERTTFDVLNAEQDLDSAQVALVESERQYNETTFQLLAAVGGLTARGLTLPVKLYDPKVHYHQDVGSWFGTGR